MVPRSPCGHRDVGELRVDRGLAVDVRRAALPRPRVFVVLRRLLLHVVGHRRDLNTERRKQSKKTLSDAFERYIEGYMIFFDTI